MVIFYWDCGLIRTYTDDVIKQNILFISTKACKHGSIGIEALHREMEATVLVKKTNDLYFSG